MDERTILFGLHELDGIGWKTILKLISRLDDIKEVATLTAQQLAALQIRPQQAQQIINMQVNSLELKLREYESRNIRIVTVYDEEYPSILKETAEPPWVLYCKGDLSLLKRPLLGMVGTRNPTTYGKKVADDLSSSLSKIGFGVVSGMARGIDTCAHIGALTGKGSTVAVLACPVDQVYPRENAYLYRDIVQKGLVLSEYPKGTAVRPGMFPQRNRIIAGLSLGVVVVEAAEGSGSLITADFALEESREVFSVPGPITSPKSEGVLRLIKQGSKMITCVEDIMEEYTHIIPKSDWSHLHLPKANLQLNKDELEIVRILSNGTLTIDDLLELSQFTFGHLHSVLLSLLMKKQIVQLPGSAYILT
jgi:DNA processing protein